MTDLDASEMSARLAAFDTDRRERRAPLQTPRRAPRMVRAETPHSDRRRVDNARIHAIKDRKPGHPLGTIDEPLPMGPLASPNTLSRAAGIE